MLVAGAELLVRGGGNVALALRIPAMVVGLTIVAFGTSAPELTVSVTAAIDASTAMAVSNVNGSNIANIAFVLGLAALVAPLTVERSLLRREVPVCLLLQAMVPVLSYDGMISRLDGGILIAMGAGYNFWLFYSVYRDRDSAPEGDFEITDDPLWKNLAMLLVGLVILVVGGRLFVGGGEALARSFGLSDHFIGLSVIALGTSAPEAATAVASARKGEVELAVGNSIGSNILNIAMVLGITALIRPIAIDGGMFVDMFIALAAVALLVPVVLKGRLNRLEGALLVLGFLGYLLARLILE